MLIPTKCSKYDMKTDKQYEHEYTKEEQREMIESILSGKPLREIKQAIIARLTDADWIEV